MLSIFIRTILFYLLLNIMLKIMGKRQIGELEVSDMITTLLLSELIATDEDKARAMASYIYKVSLLSQKKFSAEEMQGFMQDSFDMLMKL